MIKIIDLLYHIPTSGDVLKEINLSVSKGDFIGLLGKNGAGKTTLLDLIMGFRRPTSGSVMVFGERPDISERKKFQDVGYISQDIWLKDNISIKEFFEFHSYFYPNYSKEEEQRLLKIFELSYEQKIGGLSTGQKRRIQIVAVLASKPKVIIIDEITAVLDPDARCIFFDLLKEFNEKEEVAIILATNIVEDLKGRINKLYFIKNKVIKSHEASALDTLFKGVRNA